jgi:hypothetical protein
MKNSLVPHKPTLKIGDSVMVRPNFGKGDPIIGIVDVLEVTDAPREKEGSQVDEVTWNQIKKELVVISYTDPEGKSKWAYSDQLSPSE